MGYPAGPPGDRDGRIGVRVQGSAADLWNLAIGRRGPIAAVLLSHSKPIFVRHLRSECLTSHSMNIPAYGKAYEVSRTLPVWPRHCTPSCSSSPRHELPDQGELFLAEGDVSEVVLDLLGIGLGLVGLAELRDAVFEHGPLGENGVPLGLLFLRGRSEHADRSAPHVDDDMVGMRQGRRQVGDPEGIAAGEFPLPSNLVVERGIEEASCRATRSRSVADRSSAKRRCARCWPLAALTASERMIACAIDTVTLRSPSRTVIVR